jgi:dTDP-4-amino-4,6-dideoxygalactose transaminase
MSENAAKDVADVLASGYIGQGPKVDLFEELLQSNLNTKTKPVTVNSCTSALDLALHLIGVGPGDEVISTAQTCYATNSVILNRGAKIVWADIDPLTGNISPASVAKLVTKKTKAITAVNWAGRFCDYKALKALGVPVIEDAAHTWDVFYGPKPQRGDYICYSFQAIKFLTTGDGGLLVCPDEETAARARLLRWYGLDRTKGASFRCAQNIEETGFKYHMNDIAAAIGIQNIGSAYDSVVRHRTNAEIFDKNITTNSLVLPPTEESCSYWLYSLLVVDGTKEGFIAHLNDHGIASSPVHHRNDRYTATASCKPSHALPGLDSYYQEQVSIPVGWWLSPEDKDKIIDVCNKWTGWC